MADRLHSRVLAGLGDHGNHLPLTAAVGLFAGGVAHRLHELIGGEPGVVILDSVHATSVWWALQAMTAVYLVSGVSKLARTAFCWVGDAHQLALTVVARTHMETLDRPHRQRPQNARAPVSPTG